MAETGSSVNEIGSSMATVVTGPMPGSTPTRVPSRTPMKQYRRFCAVNATPKPMVRFARKSIAGLEKRRPDWQRQAQRDHEYSDREGGERHGQSRRLQRPRVSAGECRDERDHDERDHKTERLQQDAEQHHADGDNRERPELECVLTGSPATNSERATRMTPINPRAAPSAIGK